MPLPHERAAIDAATGARKEQLAQAAAVLDRVRAEYPGTNDLESLPPEVRREALDALAAFRPKRSLGTPELAALLMLAVGSGLLLFKPHRIFKCETAGDKAAHCLISERVLGVLPLRAQTVGPITAVRSSTEEATHESRDSQGRRRTATTRIGELSFLDAEGATRWSASDSHLLGANMDRVAAQVEGLIAREVLPPVILVQAVWPALLAGTLFGLIGASGIGSAFGLLLRNRGFISQGVYRSVFYWGTFVIPALLAACAWALALLGSDPPGLLKALLASA